VVVQSLSFNSNDVTEEWYDIEGRLRVLTASREQYYKLLQEAKNVNEVIAVRTYLPTYLLRVLYST